VLLSDFETSDASNPLAKLNGLNVEPQDFYDIVDGLKKTPIPKIFSRAITKLFGSL